MMATPQDLPFEIHTAQPRDPNKVLNSNFTARNFMIGDEKDFDSSSERKNKKKLQDEFNITKIKNNSESSSLPENDLKLS